ncbi:MAG: polyprenyl synthetase family protein [Planctomycetales bacterium]|nr:polyprenyl synthetase family protein [Planctomycetales bacterium]
MATVSETNTDFVATADEARDSSSRRSRRRKTSHLKSVPEPLELREQLRLRCREVADRLDKSTPLTKDQMESIARQLLADAGQPESFVGWAMVMLASEFWREQVAATDPSRRLFLLPHCLKHAEGCPADYDEFGLDCETCGACSIADFRGMAEKMGYRVLVAEGSPIVLKIIVSGYVDAIVGVACLNVLEKAIDKVLLAGIPCVAVPLLSSDCRNTSVDEAWVNEAIQLQQTQPVERTRSYVHLMRAAANMFDPDELERLAPRSRSGPRLSDIDDIETLDAIAATETIGYDFLSKGGKHSRPFITLAVHDALTGGHATGPDGQRALAEISDSVRRAAMSIETFHKASLVHDDIEDDDKFRYGEMTMHRRFGISTAINVGDYLIGLGYRLVSREAGTLGAEATSAILDGLADAHMKLSEGQGAELAWRDSSKKMLTPLDALKIYALKTSPAFEAALMTGVHLAGDSEKYRQPMKLFARNVGVAFQILNDLKDWQGDQNNKLVSGADVLGGRPTLLLALACEGLDEQDRAELESLFDSGSGIEQGIRVARVRYLYEKAGVFEKANRLVDKHQDRAEAIADEIEPDELRRLLYYLVDSVLERKEEPAVKVVDLEASLS